MEFVVSALVFIIGGFLGGLLVYKTMSKKMDGQNIEQQKVLQEVATLRAERQVLNERFNLQTQLSEKFEHLSQKIFEEKFRNFSDQSSGQLKQILDPIKEKLKDFEKKVEDTYSQERAERGTLRGEINKLFDLNQKMAQEAINLTRALKGESKLQGNWGEHILEGILERSGLRKNEEYVLQGEGMALTSNEGQAQMPDVIVLLPEEKHIVIDSKVSLKAYEAYVNSEDSDLQDKLAQEHVDSIKKHIDGLSGKTYHSNEKLGTPDFTVLFMPLEPAFALAFRVKPDLLSYAWDKGIAIVSPTTLLTTLKTVAALWKQEKQNRNALEIARSGGLLYDKFHGLLGDLEEVGSRLNQARDSYDQAIGKLSSGKGNLIMQVERLKDLGAKTEKSLAKKELASRFSSLDAD